MCHFSMVILLLFLSLIVNTVPCLAQDSSGATRIGSTLHNWGYAQNVVMRDTLVYVATAGSGLRIVNIANPQVPILSCSMPSRFLPVSISCG